MSPSRSDLQSVSEVIGPARSRVAASEMRNDNCGPILQVGPSGAVAERIAVKNANAGAADFCSNPVRVAIAGAHRDAWISPRTFPLHSDQAVLRPDGADLGPL